MNKYKLNTGDIIKIGRISLRIRDIHFSTNKNNNLNNSENGDLITKDINTLRTEANANSGSRNYIVKKINNLNKSKTKIIKNFSLTKNFLNKIEKKIKYVESVMSKKMTQKIILYYIHVYAQVQ